MKLSQDEKENLISLFWQLLVNLEGKVEDEHGPDAQLVEGGYEFANRVGISEDQPRWKT